MLHILDVNSFLPRVDLLRITWAITIDVGHCLHHVFAPTYLAHGGPQRGSDAVHHPQDAPVFDRSERQPVIALSLKKPVHEDPALSAR